MMGTMKELVYHRLLLPAIDRHHDKTAVVDGGFRSTYAEHAERTARAANMLTDLGVGRTDRFAVMALNSHRYLELQHAAFLGAGVINPLNLRLAGKELRYIIEDSGTEVLFVDGFFAQMVADALGDDSPVRTTVLLGEGDVPHDHRYEDLLAAASPAMPGEPEEDDPVVLMYTGGTTGLPKGVLHTQRSQMLNLYHNAIHLDLREDTVWLTQTPMFHAASTGGMMGVIPIGGVHVSIPMFDPGAVLDAIEAEGVTMSIMVPTMIGMMFAHESYRPERLATMRQLAYGASPMPDAILDRLLSELPDLELIQGYGMTECSATLSFLLPEDHVPGSPRLRSVGRPVMGVTISIRDDDRNEVPTGEVGEVWARGGNWMQEYWNKPEATEEAFVDGWYRTGDAGRIDDDGYLFLVDRVKDMIVTGGENVYSAEVENAISTHPGVAQVAVIGIPDERWGEAVHAIIVRVPGQEVTAEMIIAHARESIAGYKVPKSVDFRDEPLPLSGAMKVLKRELRAPYWEGHDRNVG